MESGRVPKPEITFVSRVAGFVSQILSWLLLAGGLGTAGFTGRLTVLAYSAVPWMDPWFFFYQVDQGHLSWWQLLWTQHNGHRIIFPKLFYLADLNWFHGTGILLLISIYFVQILHCLVLLYLIKRFASLSPAAFRSAAGLVLFCIFCPAKREDFIHGWEIAYVLPMFLTTLGLAAFAISSREKPASSFSRWILAGWIAALVGGFSLLSGFLIWPMLCVEAILLGLPRRTWITTAALGIAALGLNMIGFQRSVETSLGETLYNTRRLLAFFDLLMAESWQPINSYLGISIAWIGVFVCLAIVLRRWPLRAKVSGADLPLAVIALTAAGAAAMTALGRWKLGFTNRYEEPVLLFWAAFGLLVLVFATQLARPIWLMLLQAFLALIMIAGASQIRPLTIEAKYHAEALNVAGAALVSGVNDANAVGLTVMSSAWTFGERSSLKNRRAALYANRPASLVGANLFDAYRAVENGCSGRLLDTRLLEDPSWPGISLHGSAWDTAADSPIRWLVLTDRSGRIVGLGANDSLVRNRSAVKEGTWSAFAPTKSKEDRFRIYGVLSDQEVCALNGLPEVAGAPILARFNESIDGLTPLWTPRGGVPSVLGGAATIRDGVLSIRSDSYDTQAFFDTGIDLKPFSAIVIKAKFARPDTVEMYFARQVDGRGIQGSVSAAGQWVMLKANIGLNPYWKTEGGTGIRFDPTGAQGPGSVTEIAGIWGSKAAAEPEADSFEVYQAP